jgi:hypothetical protein
VQELCHSGNSSCGSGDDQGRDSCSIVSFIVAEEEEKERQRERDLDGRIGTLLKGVFPQNAAWNQRYAMRGGRP